MIVTEKYIKKIYKAQKKLDKEREKTIIKLEKNSIKLLHCYYDFTYKIGHVCDSILPKDNQDYYKFSLIRIHEHALKVFKECLVLIENGSASGAMARWRTLFEFMVVALYLDKNKSLAEKYIDFCAINDYMKAKKIHTYRDRLRVKRFDFETYKQIKNEYELIKTKYNYSDKDLTNNYLWAKTSQDNKKVTLFSLCEKLGLEHFYAYVDEAHLYVHSSPKSIIRDRGSVDPDGNRYLFTPFELSIPIQLIAISLFYVNKTLLLEYLTLAEKKEQLQIYLDISMEILQKIIPDSDSNKEPINE